jgi:tRNA pseudouridine55 synthase
MPLFRRLFSLRIGPDARKHLPFAITRSNPQNLDVDGLLIIDKPAGLSSHDVIMRARRILRTKRIGHTGTLDPFATGVLVLLIGQATRLAQFINTDEKEYLAVARCGFATDTGDLTGTRIEPAAEVNPVPEAGYSPDDFERALAPLRGEIEQIPPMYSAKKVDGRKLYELARRGETIERKPVRVKIKALEVVSPFTEVAELPPEGTWDFSFRVICSSGTYIRTLAEEIGGNLGTAAHLVELRRIRAGRFAIEESLTLEALAEMAGDNPASVRLLPPARALDGLPQLRLGPDDKRRVGHGMSVTVNGSIVGETGQVTALFDETENLLGVGQFNADEGVVKPKVMLVTGNG